MANKKEMLIGIFVVALAIIVTGLVLTYPEKEEKKEETKAELVADIIKELMEYAYFEGQKDALEGDVRIEQIYDDCWKWTKSPWNGHKVWDDELFDPCKDETTYKSTYEFK